MDAVFERDRKQFVIALREGGEQEHGVLNISDRVGTGILRRERAACFLGRPGLVGHGKKKRPLPFRADADYLGFGLAVHSGDGETSHPASGGIIRMVLAARGFADDLGILPLQTAEVIGQGDARQAGSS